MPKEQPRLKDGDPRAPTSKNAKDKSNSTTMLAIRDAKGADGSNRMGSSCSSEKDSGYSEGSDWQQTDAEDQSSTNSQRRGIKHAEASHSGQSKTQGSRNTGDPTVKLTNQAHPPVYIIKQPAVTQKRSQLSIGNSMRIISHAVSPNMIILDKQSFMPATLQHLKPLNSSVKGKKAKNTYLPILNSYPRIAPHPTKKPPDKSTSDQESQTLSKRVCTERKTEETSVSRGLSEERHHNQLKPTASNSVLLSSTSSRNSLPSSTFMISSADLGSPSISSLHAVSSDSPHQGSHRRSVTTSSRRRQFLNTVELLRQSGLLDITLRTKELLRQCNTTEQEICQLRQHTELLCQAISNPGQSLNGVTAWEHLCQTMAESGSYHNLEITQKSQNPSYPSSVGKPQSVCTGTTAMPQAAQNPCHFSCGSEQSQVKQDRKVETSERSPDKGTFMSPDSSSG
uniref:Si:ch211-132b12.7 n=1 Tax=Cyprinodon variegatus TaxID=28743 RepID=A0A3Q2DBQ8_CYPVA